MPLLVYSVLRLGLFGVALITLAWAGMRDWLLILVAAVVAWALSYVLLNRQRDAAAQWLADRAAGRRRAGKRFTRGIDADAAAEDALLASGAGGSEREAQPQQDAEAELEEPGAGEDGRQRAAAGADPDGEGEQHGR